MEGAQALYNLLLARRAEQELGHDHQELIEELSSVMADASICGLGQAAPNPIRCVHKYFRHEVGEAPWPGDLPNPGGKGRRVEPAIGETRAEEGP